MAAATFDVSKRMDLYFRVNRSGSRVLTFLENGVAYDITGHTFEFLVKDNFGNTLILTTPSPTTNTLTISMSSSQSNIPQGEYFWELRLTDDNKTWLNGKAFFHNGVYDGVTESGTTISDEDTTITVSI